MFFFFPFRVSSSSFLIYDYDINVSELLAGQSEPLYFAARKKKKREKKNWVYLLLVYFSIERLYMLMFVVFI